MSSPQFDYTHVLISFFSHLMLYTSGTTKFTQSLERFNVDIIPHNCFSGNLINSKFQYATQQRFNESVNFYSSLLNFSCLLNYIPEDFPEVFLKVNIIVQFPDEDFNEE
uniref:Uncharacterized protein n=1 Tax=Glossina pallidipes TaxID=7398 RepID=A0A1A9Z5S2_GLOPL